MINIMYIKKSFNQTLYLEPELKQTYKPYLKRKEKKIKINICDYLLKSIAENFNENLKKKKTFLAFSY